MKLKGFSLAEVLITMTLIGVIATLTLPALVTDIQRQQMGPAFMKAIGSLDTANALVTNERDLYSFGAGCGNDYNTCFASFVAPKLVAASTDNVPTYRTFTGGADFAVSNAAYLAKGGFIYYIGAAAQGDDTTEPGSEPEGDDTTTEETAETGYIDVFIDVNGTKGPNMLGKDLYHVVVDQAEGHVFAKGSNTDKSSVTKWTTTCPASGVQDNGDSCAGAVFDNGGKVPYKF